MVEAIIFAMIAAFLAFRLYAVLGKRTGHESTYSAPKPAEDLLGVSKKPEIVEEQRDVARVITAAEVEPMDGDAVQGIRAISAADSSFHAGEFVSGAEQAYRLILEAFWKGDSVAFEEFVAEDVRDAFVEAIEARVAKGETLENRLVRIERAVIAEASLVGKVARIKVQFDADIAAVTRNKKGNVIAGSLSDAVPTHDAWTFERKLRSNNPNWLLVDTDEAA